MEEAVIALIIIAGILLAFNYSYSKPLTDIEALDENENEDD